VKHSMLLAFILFAASIMNAQKLPDDLEKLPPELQVSDPESRKLWAEAYTLAKAGDYVAGEMSLNRAVARCTRENFQADCALLKGMLGQWKFLQGNIEAAEELYVSAYDGAIRSGNQVLQADLLISQCSKYRINDDINGARGQIARAVEVAQKSRNRLVLARAYAEQANVLNWAGDLKHAEEAINRAIAIAQANDYDVSLAYLYRAQILKSVKQRDNEANEALAQARKAAKAKENAYVFAFSTIELAKIAAEKGEAEHALKLLRDCEIGQAETPQGVSEEITGLKRISALPFVKLLLLITRGDIYRLMNRGQDAFEVYREVYQMADRSNLATIRAGSALEAARIAVSMNRLEEAEQYAHLAVHGFEQLGVSNQARNSKSLLAAVLIAREKYPEAIEQLLSVLENAKKDNDATAIFSTESEIGRAFFLSKDLAKASEHWANAEILVQYLFRSANLDKKALGKTLLNHYKGMLSAYIGQNRDFEALMTWPKAIAAMEDAQDEEAYSALLKELGTAIDLTKAREAAEKSYNEQRWYAALTLNQILDFYDSHSGIPFGAPRKMGGPAFNRILEIPFRMTSKEEDARMLDANLQEMGRISPVSRRVGYDALIRFYMRVSKPTKAYSYIGEILPFLKLEAEPVWEKDVETICLIGFVARQSGKDEAAKQYSEMCSAAAKRIPENTRLTEIAEQLQAQVFQFHNPAIAQKALAAILARSPDDDLAQMELANTYRSQGRLTDAFAIWDKLLTKYQNTGKVKELADLNFTVAGALLLYYPSQKAIRDPLKYLRAAKEGYSELQNSRGLFETALSEADYWTKARQKKEALNATDRAKELSGRLSDPLLAPRVTAKVAEVASTFGDHRLAIVERGQAIRFYENGGTATPEWISLLTAQGSDLAALGQINEAIDTYHSAITLSDKAGVPFYRRWPRQSLGSLYRDHSEYLLAAKLNREALEIAENANDDLGAGWSALDLGWAYFNLGEWSEAQKAGETAFNYARQQANDSFQLFTINLLMNVFGDRRSSVINPEKAVALYREAESIAKNNPDIDIGILSETAAEVFWRAGDLDSAIKYAEAACESNQKGHDDYSLAHSLMSLSESLTKKGDIRKSKEELTEAEKLVRQRRDDPYTVGRWYYTRAQWWRAQHKNKEAASDYERVLVYLGMLKSRIRDAESQRKATDTYSFVYDELVDTYFSLSQGESDGKLFAYKALEYAEAEKGRQFLNAWGPLFARQLRADLSVATREKEQALQFAADQATAQAQAAEQGGKPVDIEEARSRERAAKSELDKFVQTLRRTNAAYASVKYPATVQYTDIQRKAVETLVIFRVATEQSYLWIISDEGVLFERIQHPKQWLKNKIETIRDSFNRAEPGDDDQKALSEVFEALFPDSQSQSRLTRSKSLIVIPDDVLFLVPLEMFSLSSKPGEFPLMDKPIRYFPSLSSYVISRNVPRTQSWQTELLAVGNPQLAAPTDSPGGSRSAATEKFVSRGLSLAPLPGTQKEIDEISKLFPAGKSVTVTGMVATKQRVIQTDLSRFRFVHFATHGLLPTDSNLVEPALVFSMRDPKDEDIFLQMSEVLSLQLNSEMVVLSACNTGSGKIDHVEGVQNLGRAFMMAGSRSTVISLWQVADDSTALLMHELYKNILAGKEKDQSLAEARRFVYKNGYKHPFFWAPFVLMGD
jgi:CHAT domain-containing protein